MEFAKATFPAELRLDGLKIAVDCANGAAYRAAPTVLFELGADVVPVAVSPDGFNINRDCGATAPETLATAVVAHNADVGIALDGDADRVRMVDETGRIVDGDQIMALIARAWRSAEAGGHCFPVMSISAWKRYSGHRLGPSRQGRARYVVEIGAGRINIGGNNPAISFSKTTSRTGDGGCGEQVLAELVRTGRAATSTRAGASHCSECALRAGAGLAALGGRVRTQSPMGSRLGDSGRVVIRKSGTEPVIRVMAEGDDESLVAAVVDSICASIEAAAR